MTEKKTFQESVTNQMLALFEKLMKEHPELRSITTIFDWADDLNNGAIPGIWCDTEGPMSPSNCDAIIGSMRQTTKLMAVQADMALRMISVVDETAKQKLEILKQLEEHLDGRKQQFTKLSEEGQAETETVQVEGGTGEKTQRTAETVGD